MAYQAGWQRQVLAALVHNEEKYANQIDEYDK
jgi:hypothetical protein